MFQYDMLHRWYVTCHVTYYDVCYSLMFDSINGHKIESSAMCVFEQIESTRSQLDTRVFSINENHCNSFFNT